MMIHMEPPSCKFNYSHTAEILNVDFIHKTLMYFILVDMERLVKCCWMYELWIADVF